MVGVLYQGPWERVAGWLLAIDAKTLELRREVKNESLRGRLAAWAERRHMRWIDRYADAGTLPPARWKRR